MRAVDILRKKRDGEPLSHAEIRAFVDAATHGTWADYQLSALLMAIVLRGMTPDETAHLTGAMADSGERLSWHDLDRPCVDKHSTGGVGDKTSLILAPLAAACGVGVPMMSGRGLGHTGGTLDKLESIPGFRVDLGLDEFRSAMRTLGVALIGQTRSIAPADKKLYALRDVTATVESIPLITASILSKKIAEGITGLVMDVKCGQGAFMKTREHAHALATSLAHNGTANGVRTEAVITPMEQPCGRAVGNALEVKEAIATLQGNGPKDLENLSVLLAARMVRLAGLAETLTDAEMQVRRALTSGRGFELFRAIVEQQGGDPRSIDEPSRLPTASEIVELHADEDGYIHRLDAEHIGRGCMVLGAGRERAEDRVEPAVGAVLLRKVGDHVRRGEPLFAVHVQPGCKLGPAFSLLQGSVVIAAEPPPSEPEVYETIEAA